jgi:hypothetical protein
LDDFEEIFGKFRDESTRFSKDLYQKFYASSRATRGAAANVNLVLAKTVFSKWSIEILTILLRREGRGLQGDREETGLDFVEGTVTEAQKARSYWSDSEVGDKGQAY